MLKAFTNGLINGAMSGVQNNGRGGNNQGYSVGGREFAIGAALTATLLGVFEIGRRYGRDQSTTKDVVTEVRTESHQKAKTETEAEVKAADGTTIKKESHKAG